MLPRRGIVRALPQAGLRSQHFNSSASSRTLRTAVGSGRQFGTARNGLSAGTMLRSGLRAKSVAPALALGTASSSRAFSLWGYGSSKPTTPDASPAAPSTATSTAASTPSPAEALVSEPKVDLANAPADMDLSSLTDLVQQQENILNMPEKLGYLHNIGLEYGFGPTSVMQNLLESIHVYTGFGWGGSIIATAFLVRVAMFYPQVISMQNNAKMVIMRQDPRHDEVMKSIKEGQQKRDMAMMQKGQYLSKKLREEYGVSVSKSLLGLVQIPFTFGLFRIITGMSALPVPSLETAGFLWFENLTATDPYFLLPLGAAGFMIGGMKIMNKYTPPEQTAMMKPLMYIMGPIVVIATSFLSAGINLMGVAFGASTFLQAVILNIPSIRSALGIPTPVRTPAASAATIPTSATYQAPRAAPLAPISMREKLQGQLKDAQKGLNNQIGNITGKYAATEEEKTDQKRKASITKMEATRKRQEREEFERKYKSRR